MAVIWRYEANGSRYEVRSAGRTIRLYTDGVFHSQYSPLRAVTCGVWDLLFLPAFFAEPGTIRRALVLGVGGGAVVRLLQRHVEPDEVTGVDLDPVHLDVARRFFGVAEPVRLVEAEAAGWLMRYRGPAFDLLIDDVFGESEREPVRAVAATARWFGRLSECLGPDGILVMNFVSRKELTRCAWMTDASVRREFPAAFQFSHPRDENRVGVFLRHPVDRSVLQERVRNVGELAIAIRQQQLRFQVRELKPVNGRASA